MSPSTSGDLRADRMAAHAVGFGVGLIALMLTWLVGNRVLSMFLDGDLGPTVAFAAALVVGAIVARSIGRRLAATVG